ncbi:MAG TPA: TatD family hydrolase [Chitinivibrionales bacterium]|nr:TatD family hydrolase [Chitinivibrionales bacterium]
MEADAGISFFDAHCHVQDGRLAAGLDAVLSRAACAGVKALSCCGTSEKDWNQVRGLAEKYEAVRPSFGLHPWYVAGRSEHWADALVSHLDKMPHACVGEIGLDHALDESTFADQESVFLKQLAIAAEHKRPVTIHCRRAFGRLVELLKVHGGAFQGGIVHSFSGPAELVKTIEGFGLSLSFSGTITFPKNKRSRAALLAASRDRLCIETDSPDLKPYQCATELNEPANVVKVAETVALLLGISKEEVAARTWNNATRIFK